MAPKVGLTQSAVHRIWKVSKIAAPLQRT